ncbi:ABC transporter substrate-binding protein [Saccharopolyspora sp. K220]|uniref:ABC transporter substrate-binding protein n=1 Tax=Saccharopolyspora soli TaxID=2926618 RepID=UPI001F5A1C05|nr:ABC transporter substrate-binding protein [Saccharopolyspora soli]MCI2417623.1 ABC transporter substrate-binding protein [Saccharopolyspora soli]
MDEQQQARGAGRMRRRTLLGAGLGLMGTAVLAGGCGGAGAAPLPTAAATGVPRPGGVLRIARPPASQAETLDPASSLSAYEYLGALYNRVVRIDRDGEVAPDLAESWESDPLGMRWRFRLRRDVHFHDGKPFTAADVVYTVRRILDPALSSPQEGVLSPLLDPAGISAPDEHTVEFALKSPNAEFPSLLTAYQCYVVPDGSGATIAQTGIGTGPFRLESFTAAGRGRVVANPDHFAGVPVLSAIEYFSIADTQARANALLAGQVHLLSQTNLDFATARVINSAPRTTIARAPNSQWYGLPMLCTAPPFTDPLVRKAFKLAYDQQSVFDVAIQRAGALGNDNPVPPDNPMWTDYRVQHDPDRARALLKQAGQENLALDVYTSSYDPVFTPMALAFADSAAQAGIRLRVRTASADSYYSQIWMRQPLCATYWYTGRPIDQLLNQIFRGGSSYNETGWADPAFDAMLDAARREMDPARRRVHYQDAQRYVVDNSGSITPMFADRLVGISREVLNYSEYGFEFDYLHIGLRES